MKKRLGIEKTNFLGKTSSVRFNTYADGQYIATATMDKPYLSTIFRVGNRYYLQFHNNETFFGMFCDEVVKE